MPLKPRKILMEFDGKEYEIDHLRLSKTNFSFETTDGKNEWFIHPIGKIKINIIHRD